MPLYVVCILERATCAVKKKGDIVKRVVVTGATGAIGRSLIKVCIKKLVMKFLPLSQRFTEGFGT